MLDRLRTFFARRWISLGLAVLSGVGYFVGFCGYEQWYLSWLCLVPVLWALDDETLSGREALVIAWTFGLTTHMGGYTWIVHLLKVFAFLPLPLALLGYVLLCTAQGSILAVWGWSVNRLTQKLHLPVVWVAPVAMAVVEWLYPLLFPSYLSNSQYRQIVFIQTLDLWGPIGITFILVLASAVAYQTLAALLRNRGRAPLAGWLALAVLVGGSLAYGVAAVADIDDTVASADRRVRIGMVQANMGVYSKTRDPHEGLRRHRDGSLEVERQGADLIVWPESAFFFSIYDETRQLKNAVQGPLKTPILFGSLRVEPVKGAPIRDYRYHNTAFLIDAGGKRIGHYDKNVLLAFGEFVPFGEYFPFVYEWFPEASRFIPGKAQVPLELDGVEYGVLICYEDVMPSFVRKVMAHEPDVLVNLTNDAWFGETNEPLIHLALSTFRAVETRRFLVRSTNTGISAFVDPAGRILAQTPVSARANLVRDIVPLTGTTLYVRFGEWVAMVCAAVTLWWIRDPIRTLAGGARRRRTTATEPGAPPTSVRQSGKRNDGKRKRRRK